MKITAKAKLVEGKTYEVFFTNTRTGETVADLLGIPDYEVYGASSPISYFYRQIRIMATHRNRLGWKDAEAEAIIRDFVETPVVKSSGNCDWL